MATGSYAPDPDLHIVDANGVPISGGLVWTYLAGTLTPTPTYTDVTLTNPNTNPIVAGSDGRFVAFLAGGVSYKFVYETPAIAPAHGAVLVTRDNILAVTSLAAGGGVTQRTSLSGTVNDFALVPGCSVLYCDNPAPLTFTGFSGGVPGQRLTVYAATTNLVYVSPADAGSLAPNRVANYITAGPTPLYTTGGTPASISYIYSGIRWDIVGHAQGEWIPVPFSAANFGGTGGMTWTVAAGNVNDFSYLITGKMLTLHLSLSTTTIGGTLSYGATVLLPNGYNTAAISGAWWYANAGAWTVGAMNTTGVAVMLMKDPSSGANFLAGTLYMAATVVLMLV